MKKKTGILSKLLVILVLLYLYVPIIVLMVLSFNESRYNSLPIHFTMKWYQELAGDTALITAAKNSLLLALLTGIICIILATLFTLGQRYLSKKLNGLFNSIVMNAYEHPMADNRTFHAAHDTPARILKEHVLCTGGACDNFSSVRSFSFKARMKFHR